MKIGWDGRVFNHQTTGIGRVNIEMLREITLLMQEDDFYIFSNKYFQLPFERDNIHIVIEESILKYIPLSNLWYRYTSFFTINKYKLDYFFGGNFLLPKFLSKKTKLITHIYDFNYLLYPSTMKFSNFILLKLFLEYDAKRAQYITTISNGTKKKIEKYYNLQVNEILYPCVSEIFTVKNSEKIKEVKNKFNIQSKYLLAVSTLEPRKNFEVLVLAFTELVNEKKMEGYKLLLVGGSGWKNEKLSSLLFKYKNYIVQLGYVDDNDLATLYSGTELFIFPSLYEGFGIPVVEALSCGAKVLASNIEEVQEAGDKYAYYVNPTKNEIKKGILNSLTEQKPLNYVNVFKWKTEAKKLKKLFQDKI